MALDITIIENNDPTLIFNLKQDGVAPDLTGADVEFYVKEKVNQPDSEGATYTVGNGKLSILDAATAKVEVQIEGDDLTKPKMKYHLDVIKTGKRLTYAYGTITVVQV